VKPLTSEVSEKVLRIYTEAQSLLMLVSREVFDEFTSYLQGFRTEKEAIDSIVSWLKTLSREALKITEHAEKTASQ